MFHHILIHATYPKNKAIGLFSTTDPVFFKENFGSAALKESISTLTSNDPPPKDADFLFLRKTTSTPALIKEFSSEFRSIDLGVFYRCKSDAMDAILKMLTVIENTILRNYILFSEAAKLLKEVDSPYNLPPQKCCFERGKEDEVFKNLIISCAQGGKAWMAYKQDFEQECLSRSFHPHQVRDCMEIIAKEPDFSHNTLPLLKLQLELITATEAEDYETAAKLRDRFTKISTQGY